METVYKYYFTILVGVLDFDVTQKVEMQEVSVRVEKKMIEKM